MYECSRCEKRFHWLTKAESHLEKKHNGEGYLFWFTQHGDLKTKGGSHER